MSNVLFNVNDLISPTLKEMLEGIADISDKVKFLFQVIDFAHYFDGVLVNEISNFYIAQTGERYELIYLSGDDKEFLEEYASCIQDFEKTKQVLNGICSDETYDECLAKAQEEIEQIRELQQGESKSQSLTTHLVFNDDEPSSDSTKSNKHKSLDMLLAEAQAKADERNRQA